MSIADPHAIPETEHDCHEYLTEADHAYDAGDTATAAPLYWSVTESHFAKDAQSSHAYLRVGLIAMNDGDNDRAYFALSQSHEPAAAEVLKSLGNATHDDPTPSPDTVPESEEQAIAWFHAGEVAADAGDWQLASGLFTAVTQAEGVIQPGQLAAAMANVGVCAHHLGDDDTARLWIQHALPNVSDESPFLLTKARELLKKYGGGHETAADDTPASKQVAAGIQAYENGDAHDARVALQASLHLDGPDDQKGRARYYLGSMDYQEHKYADARVHIEAAVQAAPEPEKSWAEAALHWRWNEDPPAAP